VTRRSTATNAPLVRSASIATVRRVALVVAVWTGLALSGCASSTPEAAVHPGDAALARAFDEQADDLPVEGRGTVTRILADDTEGDRHQRFIVRLVSGQTLLVAHNIDVAPRIEALREGDAVAFRGVYEWNAEGGLVHWTHHDPDGSHASGWLRYGGRTYE